MVHEPPVVVWNVTEQLLVAPTGFASAQVEEVNVPPPVVVNATVPSRLDPAPPVVSVTVTVQEASAPTGRVLAPGATGTQLTVVSVPCLTVNGLAFEVPPPGPGLTTVML